MRTEQGGIHSYSVPRRQQSSVPQALSYGQTHLWGYLWEGPTGWEYSKQNEVRPHTSIHPDLTWANTIWGKTVLEVGLMLKQYRSAGQYLSPQLSLRLFPRTGRAMHALPRALGARRLKSCSAEGFPPLSIPCPAAPFGSQFTGLAGGCWQAERPAWTATPLLCEK